MQPAAYSVHCVIHSSSSAHSLYPPAERGYLGFLEVGDKGGGLRIFRIQGGFRFCGHRNFPGGVGFWKKNRLRQAFRRVDFQKFRLRRANYLVKIDKFLEILHVSGINHIYYSINLLNTTLG